MSIGKVPTSKALTTVHQHDGQGIVPDFPKSLVRKLRLDEDISGLVTCEHICQSCLCKELFLE